MLSTPVPVALLLKPDALTRMDAAAACRPGYRIGRRGQPNAGALTGVKSTASKIKSGIQAPGIKSALRIASLHGERTGQDLFDAMRELFDLVDEDGNVIKCLTAPQLETAA